MSIEQRTLSEAPAPVEFKAMEATKALHDPSIPPDGRCPLLELPRELRDMIYEYALAEVGGLVKDSSFAVEPTGVAGHFYAAGDGTDKRDANQLKFVSRQLHSETAGLGLRYNDLTFYHNLDQFGIDIFEDFVIHECSSIHLKRIKNVLVVVRPFEYDHLTVGRPFGVPLSDNFTAYCQANPSTTITLRLELFDGSTGFHEWLEIGSIMQYAMRRTVPDISPLVDMPKLLGWCKRWIKQDFGDPFTIPPNIRIFPAEFVEATFLQSALDSGFLKQQVGEWVEQCKRWCDEGF